MRKKKYHGTVYANGTAVYEGWYETRRKAVTDLKREARETVLNSFDEDADVDFTLSRGGMVVENREMPKQRFRGRYPGPFSPPYGLMPVSGTRIC
jgi:hypothetical protein